MEDAKPILCPSSRCESGHLLLGVVQADGTVGFLAERMPVDDEFVAVARRGRRPEKRFRFASKCAESGCRQWTGSSCGVIEEVFDAVPEHHRRSELPDCSIRPQCRWFGQEGEAACGVCPLVITDLMVDD